MWCVGSIFLLVIVTVQGILASWSPPPLGGLTPDKADHVLWGFVCTVIVLFAHTITMFYFIGTGTAVKEEARKNKALIPLYQRTRKFKARTSGMLTLAPLLLMAASITGAGAAGGSIPPEVHLWLEAAAVAFNIFALWKAQGVIAENVLLMQEANRIASSPPSQTAASGGR